MFLNRKTTALLKENYKSGIWLFMITVFSYALIYFISFFVVVFIKKLQFNIESSFNVVGNYLFYLIFLGLYLLLLAPLILGIKRWYFNLAGKKEQVRTGFYYFFGIKEYILSVWFSIVKYAIIVTAFLVLLLPSSLILNLICLSLKQYKQLYGTEFVTLTVIWILMTILQLVLFILLMLGMFFYDYLFIIKRSKNPFKVAIDSFKTLNKNKGMFVKMLFTLLPYGILCLTVIPILFFVPKLKSICALFVKTCLFDNLEENYVKA